VIVETFDPGKADLTRWAMALAARSSLAWLDGAAGHGEAGRFSFLGCDPVETRSAATTWKEVCSMLDELAQDRAIDRPLVGALTVGRVPRWVGYVAYDATFLRDDVAAPTRPKAAHSPLWFGRYDAWLVLDHIAAAAWIVGESVEACAGLRRKLDGTPRSMRAATGLLECGDAEQHIRAIDVALDAIGRGDLYQVNLAREWQAPMRGDALALWAAMRVQGAVPMGAYLDVGDHQVLARTMECFVAWDRSTGRLETRPIKGTVARRGDRDAEDADALLNDDKERAEHAMIVDLMRNDLGRVAEVGSVRPFDVMRVEPYAGLSHLVSSVRCKTRPEVGLGKIFDATFPPGSVTGTPKLAAIAQIEALEAQPRGIYTGAVGYVDASGGCQFAVAIRTAVVRDGVARYFAGGGIVEASRSESELAETTLKARVFTDAIRQLHEEPPPQSTGTRKEIEL